MSAGDELKEAAARLAEVVSIDEGGCLLPELRRAIERYDAERPVREAEAALVNTALAYKRHLVHEVAFVHAVECVLAARAANQKETK